MDYDIDKATASVVKMRLLWVSQAQEAREFLLRGGAALNVFFRMLPQGSWCESWSDALHIHVNVRSMKEVAPMLESLGEIYGIEFDEELTDAENATRTFEARGCRFVALTAHVSDDQDAACRRVVVGEQIVPKYEIVCDGDTPAAPEAK